MKYFIDTADVAEIREAASWGLIDGVTTNPSLMAKTGRPYHDVLREICEIVDGPISAEVVATEASAMIEEGEKLAKLHKNIVVKCPMIIEGLKATHALAKRGIRVNVTLIFTPLQALAAAKVGASFLSPFIGRRYGANPLELQLPSRSAGSIRPQHNAPDPSSRSRRRHRNSPVRSVEADVASSADGSRPRALPGRLAQDKPEDLNDLAASARLFPLPSGEDLR